MGLGRIGSGFGAGFGELVGSGTVFAMDSILGLRGEIDDPRDYLDRQQRDRDSEVHDETLEAGLVVPVAVLHVERHIPVDLPQLKRLVAFDVVRDHVAGIGGELAAPRPEDRERRDADEEEGFQRNPRRGVRPTARSA